MRLTTCCTVVVVALLLLAAAITIALASNTHSDNNNELHLDNSFNNILDDVAAAPTNKVLSDYASDLIAFATKVPRDGTKVSNRLFLAPPNTPVIQGSQMLLTGFTDEGEMFIVRTTGELSSSILRVVPSSSLADKDVIRTDVRIQFLRDSSSFDAVFAVQDFVIDANYVLPYVAQPAPWLVWTYPPTLKQKTQQKQQQQQDEFQKQKRLLFSNPLVIPAHVAFPASVTSTSGARLIIYGTVNSTSTANSGDQQHGGTIVALKNFYDAQPTDAYSQLQWKIDGVDVGAVYAKPLLWNDELIIVAAGARLHAFSVNDSRSTPNPPTPVWTLELAGSVVADDSLLFATHNNNPNNPSRNKNIILVATSNGNVTAVELQASTTTPSNYPPPTSLWTYEINTQSAILAVFVLGENRFLLRTAGFLYHIEVDPSIPDTRVGALHTYTAPAIDNNEYRDRIFYLKQQASKTATGSGEPPHVPGTPLTAPFQQILSAVVFVPNSLDVRQQPIVFAFPVNMSIVAPPVFVRGDDEAATSSSPSSSRASIFPTQIYVVGYDENRQRLCAFSLAIDEESPKSTGSVKATVLWSNHADFNPRATANQPLPDSDKNQHSKEDYERYPYLNWPHSRLTGLVPTSLQPPLVSNGTVYVAATSGGSESLIGYNAANVFPVVVAFTACNMNVYYQTPERCPMICRFGPGGSGTAGAGTTTTTTNAATTATTTPIQDQHFTNLAGCGGCTNGGVTGCDAIGGSCKFCDQTGVCVTNRRFAGTAPDSGCACYDYDSRVCNLTLSLSQQTSTPLTACLYDPTLKICLNATTHLEQSRCEDLGRELECNSADVCLWCSNLQTCIDVTSHLNASIDSTNAELNFGNKTRLLSEGICSCIQLNTEKRRAPYSSGGREVNNNNNNNNNLDSSGSGSGEGSGSGNNDNNNNDNDNTATGGLSSQCERAGCTVRTVVGGKHPFCLQKSLCPPITCESISVGDSSNVKQLGRDICKAAGCMLTSDSCTSDVDCSYFFLETYIAQPLFLFLVGPIKDILVFVFIGLFGDFFGRFAARVKHFLKRLCSRVPDHLHFNASATVYINDASCVDPPPTATPPETTKDKTKQQPQQQQPNQSNNGNDNAAEEDRSFNFTFEQYVLEVARCHFAWDFDEVTEEHEQELFEAVAWALVDARIWVDVVPRECELEHLLTLDMPDLSQLSVATQNSNNINNNAATNQQGNSIKLPPEDKSKFRLQQERTKYFVAQQQKQQEEARRVIEDNIRRSKAQRSQLAPPPPPPSASPEDEQQQQQPPLPTSAAAPATAQAQNQQQHHSHSVVTFGGETAALAASTPDADESAALFERLATSMLFVPFFRVASLVEEKRAFQANRAAYLGTQQQQQQNPTFNSANVSNSPSRAQLYRTASVTVTATTAAKRRRGNSGTRASLPAESARESNTTIQDDDGDDVNDGRQNGVGALPVSPRSGKLSRQALGREDQQNAAGTAAAAEMKTPPQQDEQQHHNKKKVNSRRSSKVDGTDQEPLIGADNVGYSSTSMHNNNNTSSNLKGSVFSSGASPATEATTTQRTYPELDAAIRRTLRMRPRKLQLADFEDTVMLQKMVQNDLIHRASCSVFYSHSRLMSQRVASTLSVFPSLRQAFLYVGGIVAMMAFTVISITRDSTYRKIQTIADGCVSSSSSASSGGNNGTDSSGSSFDRNGGVSTSDVVNFAGALPVSAAAFFLVGWRLLNSSTFSTAILVFTKLIRGAVKRKFYRKQLSLEEKIPLRSLATDRTLQFLLFVYFGLVSPFALTGITVGWAPRLRFTPIIVMAPLLAGLFVAFIFLLVPGLRAAGFFGKTIWLHQLGDNDDDEDDSNGSGSTTEEGEEDNRQNTRGNNDNDAARLLADHTDSHFAGAVRDMYDDDEEDDEPRVRSSTVAPPAAAKRTTSTLSNEQEQQQQNQKVTVVPKAAAATATAAVRKRFSGLSDDGAGAAPAALAAAPARSTALTTARSGGGLPVTSFLSNAPISAAGTDGGAPLQRNSGSPPPGLSPAVFPVYSQQLQPQQRTAANRSPFQGLPHLQRKLNRGGVKLQVTASANNTGALIYTTTLSAEGDAAAMMFGGSGGAGAPVPSAALTLGGETAATSVRTETTRVETAHQLQAAPPTLWNSFLYFLLSEELPMLIVTFALQMAFNLTSLYMFAAAFDLLGDGAAAKALAFETRSRSLSCAIRDLRMDVGADAGALSSVFPFM